MKTLSNSTLALAVALATCAVPCSAALFKVDFNFTNYYDINAANSPAPQRQVIGSISYVAESAYGLITALSAVDLTIAGHTYTLDELGSVDRGVSIIGPMINFGPASVGYFTDDFRFSFFANGNGYLDYTTAATGTIFLAREGVITVNEIRAAVPEPSSLALLLAGLGCLGWGSVGRTKRVARYSGSEGQVSQTEARVRSHKHTSARLHILPT